MSRLSTSLFLTANNVYAKLSAEIPRINTARTGDVCGSLTRPAPLLSEQCTEPIAFSNHTGEWVSSDGSHWEFIEQCGSRYSVTSKTQSGHYLVHDFLKADFTVENGCQDYSGPQLPACAEIKVAGKFEGACFEMHTQLGGTMVKAVTRCLKTESGSDVLVWTWMGKVQELRRVGEATGDTGTGSGSTSGAGSNVLLSTSCGIAMAILSATWVGGF